jgi:SAM-dependent methyltransferase
MAWESERYRSISALISRASPPGEQLDILDVGCGPGYIVPHLPPFGSYTGLDISAAAISRAPRGQGIEHAVAALEHYEPARPFSIILFNEVLYYCQFEIIIPRYRKFLKPNGHIVTSMYDGPGQTPGVVEAISRCLDQNLVLLERTTLTDQWFHSWTMAMHALAAAPDALPRS